LLEAKLWVATAKAGADAKEEKITDEKPPTLVFAGGKGTLSSPDVTVELSDIKLDPTAKPKTIHLVAQLGEEKHHVAATYEPKGEEFRIACNAAADDKVELRKPPEKAYLRMVFAGKEKPKK